MEINQNPFALISKELQNLKEDIKGIRVILASSSNSEKKFYSIAEASAKLGVAEITMYRNVQAGRIPSKKIGSRVMIPGSFVDK